MKTAMKKSTKKEKFGISTEKAHRWFDENEHWLRGWIALENILVMIDPSPEDQTFFRSRSVSLEYHPRINAKNATKQMHADLLDEFVPMVLATLVFGVATRSVGEFPSVTIDGFVALYGRLPTPKDKITIYASEFSPAKIWTTFSDLNISVRWRIHRLFLEGSK